MALEYPDTYIDVIEARAYADLMGLELPEEDEALELLLRRSAILLDRKYSSTFISTEEPTGKFLSALGQAQTELASLIFVNDGVMPNVDPSIKKETTKLEGLETTIEYADASGFYVNPFATIDSILYSFLTTSIVSTPTRARSLSMRY